MQELVLDMVADNKKHAIWNSAYGGDDFSYSMQQRAAGGAWIHLPHTQAFDAVLSHNPSPSHQPTHVL